jgi:hypothetical protein
MKCQAYPDGDDEHPSNRVLFNPMSEYINRHGEEAVQQSFDRFRHKHGYNYKDEHEHRQRLKTYRHNIRYINTRNRAALTYRMKLNRFADRTVRRTVRLVRDLTASFRTTNYEYFVVDVIRRRLTMAVYPFLAKS